ncbi:MAG: PDZ domain-containing protein [Proteobacteria bacterium]|uniref:PDZ domain-containing protein n=1 Tax=Rudaea sp. TaxID=2136325 RepID=UPI00321FFDB0|nr:PDZ domain-containing protein [Pseudomonadota bacterium]
MRFRIRLTFAAVALVVGLLAACGTRAKLQEDDKKAAINAALAFERAVQAYDFDKADSLVTPNARWIEESYSHPVEPDLRQTFQPFKDTGIRFEYGPRDAVANLENNVAVVTLTLHSTWTADTPAGRATLGGSKWRAIFVESMVLVRSREGWRITFGHTTQLPPDIGVTPDYHWEHGGMRLAEVRQGGPADRAGVKAGDVMIEYGGQKITRMDDFYRLRYAQHEGDKVMVTVMRGNEEVAKEMIVGEGL